MIKKCVLKDPINNSNKNYKTNKNVQYLFEGNFIKRKDQNKWRERVYSWLEKLVFLNYQLLHGSL